MKKFFIVYKYSKNVKVNMATLRMKGKVDIWRKDLNNVKRIREVTFSWK